MEAGPNVFGERAISEKLLEEEWSRLGFTVLDRASLGKATEAKKPPLRDLRNLQVRYVLKVSAVGSDTGPIMGTSMHSLRGHVAMKLVEVKSGRVVVAEKEVQASGHIDPMAGVHMALQKSIHKATHRLAARMRSVKAPAKGPSL